MNAVAAAHTDTTTDPAHQLLVYHDAEEFLGAAVPYLCAGIAEGAPVLVVLPAQIRRDTQDALGADAAAEVDWSVSEQWYRYPAHLLARAWEFTSTHRGRSARVRMLGEPVWARHSAFENVEWARFEAALNLAFPGTSVVCPYDARVVDDTTMTVAVHTHSLLLSGTETRPNPGYVDPPAYARRCDTRPLRPPPRDVTTWSISGDLGAVRRSIAAIAAKTGVDPDRVDDLILAVNEAATNAVEHGGGRGLLRCWTTPSSLICEVSNAAGAITDPFPGYLPPEPLGVRGRGLWLIRQLTDMVEIRGIRVADSGRPGHGGADTAAAGVTVRMHILRAG